MPFPMKDTTLYNGQTDKPVQPDKKPMYNNI